jgi:hypothetical protein
MNLLPLAAAMLAALAGPQDIAGGDIAERVPLEPGLHGEWQCGFVRVPNLTLNGFYGKATGVYLIEARETRPELNSYFRLLASPAGPALWSGIAVEPVFFVADKALSVRRPRTALVRIDGAPIRLALDFTHLDLSSGAPWSEIGVGRRDSVRFVEALVRARSFAITLYDSAGAELVTRNFDTAPSLADMPRALLAAKWTC